METVIGYDKLKRQLDTLAKLETKSAEMAVASFVLEDSQLLVPVDRGDLKDSGEIIDTNGVKVIYTAGHALFVEMGTYKMAAQPYLRPAIDNNKNRLAEVAGREVELEIKRLV